MNFTRNDKTTRTHDGTRALLACCGLALAAPGALGAPEPDAIPRAAEAGVQLEAARRLDAVVLPQRATGRTVIRADMPRTRTSLSSLRLSVNGFRVENHPFIPAAELDRVLEPWRGRELSFPEFEQAVHAVAEYLRANGHPKAEVVVSRAAIRDGMVAIAVQGLEAGQPAVPTVAVREFDVTGLTTSASAEELRPVLEPYAERELTVPEMQKAAEAVAAHLRNKGYPLAQAFLPPQKIDQGRIEIRVQEGIVDGKSGRGGVTVSGGGERVKPQVIETILSSAVTPGEPVRAVPLERAIRVAADLPGISAVRANLVPGGEPGTTQVQALVEEGKLLSGAAWADNYGNRYTGTARLSGVVNLNSPSGHGEQYSLNASVAERMSSVKLAGQAPIGASGLRAGLSYAQMEVDIGGEFAPLNLNSDTRVLSAFASYPLVRGDTRNVWLAANLDDKRVRNNLLGLRENDRQLTVLTLSASGDFVDRWRGINAWGASLGVGDLNIHGNEAYQAADDVFSKTGGSFQKLNWNVSRLTPLNASGSLGLYLGLTGQFASKNLDSVEKFQLGGPSGVRAYPVGEGLGDEGWLANLELRGRVAANRFGEWTVYGFYDVGGITQYKRPWQDPSGQPLDNHYILDGYGVGASLEKRDVGSLRIVFAKKAGSNPNPTPAGTDSDGQDRDPRVWVLGSIVF